MREHKSESSNDETIGSVDVSELIAKRAHEIFQSRGGQHGHDLDDWLQAEQEVRSSVRSETLVSSVPDQQLAAKAGATTSLAPNEFQASKRTASGKKR